MNDAIKEAREGIRFGRKAEKNPLWHVITIRMRVPSPIPEILGVDTGNAAARRLYLFCVNILAGADLIDAETAENTRKVIKAVYAAKEQG